MTVLQAVIVAARAIRSERDIHPRVQLPLWFKADDLTLLRREKTALEVLTNGQVVKYMAAGEEVAGDCATAVAEGVTIYVPLEGLVDSAKEKERVERQIQKLKKDLVAIDKKLSNAGFIERAPAEVVATERARKTELEAAVAQLEAALAKLNG
jgi:valyl-tRNA synthetase